MANDTQHTQLFKDIKFALGEDITDKIDSSIEMFIEAGKNDLAMAGIVSSKIVETDALIYSALMSFVLSMVDTYEYRELSANAYALQKDQLRHYNEYIS